MAIAVSNLLSQATDILLDSGFTRWTQAELLRWLNAGRREIAILRPDLYSKISVHTLSAGTKQTIPSDGNNFLDAIRNVASDSVTPGRSVRVIEQEVLDAIKPNWHSETASGTIKHFMFDERTPKHFFVYPPAVANTKLEIRYSTTPVDVTANDSLTDDEIWSSAIVDYVLYRAFSKDAEYTGNMARAAAHYTQFANTLGISLKNRIVSSPNTANVGGAVPRVGLAAQS